MTITIGNQRRDGKYPVTLYYPGAPNAFGGFYYGNTYRKLYSPEKLAEVVYQSGTDEQKKWAAYHIPHVAPPASEPDPGDEIEAVEMYHGDTLRAA